jgi:cytochrome c oxidase cbb3-type subunit I/II
MIDPRSITPGSNMPPYAHLAETKLDLAKTGAKMHALAQVGVPYTDAQVRDAASDARDQGSAIAKDLATEGAEVPPDTQLVAVIAYLQRLGKKPEPVKPSGGAVSMGGDK